MFRFNTTQEDAEHYKELWMDACNKNEELRRERDDLHRTTALMVETIDQQRATISELEQANTSLEVYLQEKMDPTCAKAEEAAQAWDNFLQQHEDELVNLRRISKERKQEVAKLNQQLADAEDRLSKAEWIEDSLRFEIDQLRHQVKEADVEAKHFHKLWNEVRKDHQDLSQQFAQLEKNPMREVRQAHQEAAQWQERCEEAEASLEDIARALFGLRDSFQFSADDLSLLFEDLGLEEPEEEVALDTFKPITRTYISGEEIEAAYDRHWRERDKK